jgi:type VI secretion system secreted protein Hcp
MAHGAYLSITGQRQGKIRGPVTLPGLKDSIRVFGGTHEVLSPRDAATRLPTGRRVHKPLIIVKEVDCSSPMLMSALVANENLKEVVLQFWQQDRAGRDVPFYTIRLLNASITGIRLVMAAETNSGLSMPPEQEEVTFVYRRIIWTWEQGGVCTSDDWEQDVV